MGLIMSNSRNFNVGLAYKSYSFVYEQIPCFWSEMKCQASICVFLCR